MRKLLLILQFSPYDKEVAKELLKLLVELEPEVCPYADFMFSASFETSVDPWMVELAKTRFSRVYTHQCHEPIKGWPYGPNSQVREVVSDVFVGHRDRGFDYAAFMLMEPDFVPLARYWIVQLYNEWHYGGSQQILGAWMQSGQFFCYSTHINGNMLIDPQFVKNNKFFRTVANGSWDTYMAPIILPVARPSKLIWNDYRINSVHNPLEAGVTLEKHLFSAKRYPDNHPLAGQDIWPCYFHGSKGLEAISIVRKKLLS